MLISCIIVSYGMNLSIIAPHRPAQGRLFRAVAVAFIMALTAPFNIFSATFAKINTDSIGSAAARHSMLPARRHMPATRSAAPAVTPDTTRAATPDTAAFPDSVYISDPVAGRTLVEGDSISTDASGETVLTPEGFLPVDTCTSCLPDADPDYVVREFNPSPTRAVWLSALFPGLGQLYNRRYWKLPIVVGGYMGLVYGYSWNNRMLDDYTQAYRDLMDNDPSTNSYMDFYPPGTDESQLNKVWLEKLFKTRKNFYRRNRDLCIVAMVGVYLVAMVDAYVDASLTHFDISPDLAFDIVPSVIPDGHNKFPGVGLAWAITF